ncbi:MAG TPA: tetratricopeptide repeat protein [Patescibacteria group bacterium]|nr:tetratricopeptide repeat protein [Patescibacteria group bacterium]
MRFTFASILLSLALSLPAHADTGEKSAASEKINIQLDPEVAEAEVAYVTALKPLTKEQKETLSAYDKEIAASAEFELQVARMALKMKYCTDSKSVISQDAPKYANAFAIYRSQQQAEARAARKHIQERQDDKVAFIDPVLTKGHSKYLVSLVTQLGFHTMQVRYMTGKFAGTDCAGVARELEAAAARGSPIIDAIDASPEKIAEVQRLAKSGDKDGLFLLGMLTATGKGVSKDPEKALLLLRQAAEKGLPKAQLVLGLALTSDMLGLAQDPAEGKYWLEKAAAKGVPQAETALKNLDAAPQ